MARRDRLVAAALDRGQRLVDRVRSVPLLLAFELATRRFLADGMLDRAASLAYYGLLSLLPTLMIASGVFRLVGADASTANDFDGYLTDQGASSSLANLVQSVMQTAADSAPSEASAIGLIGLVTLIYGASRVFVAAGRALDVIQRRKSRGLTIFRRATGIGWTLVLLVLGMIAVVFTFVGRGLVEDVLSALGLSSASAPLWTMLRWPIAAVSLMLAMRLVMWAAPSPPRGHFRLLSPGSIVAASAWFGASVAYAIYIGEIATYNATYGAFAALVILMLWIWLTSIAFLFGCEFDAVLAERHAQRVSDAAAAESTAPAPAPGSRHPAPAEPPHERTRAEGR